MNKKSIIVRIALLGVIVILLLGALTIGLSRGFSFFRFGTFRTGDVKLVHEQTIGSTGIQTVNLDFGSTDVEVYVSEDSTIRIQQLASGDISEEEFFTATSSSGTLAINEGTPRTFLGLFRINPYQLIKLYLPRTFAGNLSIKTSSGNVVFENEMRLQNVDLRLSSGEYRSEHAVNASQFTVVVTSGNIDMVSLVCQNYQVKSTSGNVRIDSLEGTGSVNVTSGNIRISAVKGASHSIQATSGTINIGNFSGAGTIHTSSGSITAAILKLDGNLTVSATSGDIRLTAGADASFDLLASCVSGSVRGNIGMSVTDNGKAASAHVGSNPSVTLTAQTTSGNITIDRMK